MKKILMKNVYRTLAIIIFVIGLLFSYIIAETNDAPGFIIFGSGATTLFCALLFGLGELIDTFKSNNKILAGIYEELKNKKE